MYRLTLSTSRHQARSSRCAVPRSRNIITRRLFFSTSTQTPKQPQQGGTGSNNPHNTELPPELDNIGIPPTNFAKPTLAALNFWYRFAKFSFIGIAVLAGGTFAALEGTHYWVEHVGLAPLSDPDGELERWGWSKDAERWTGGANGGTDPALSVKAKYALRSAWITEHWGTGAQIISTNAIARAQQSADKAVEARLEYSHDFLTLALALATEDERAGKPLRPETVSEIQARKASTLERIGSRVALYDARAAYEYIWDTQAKLGPDAEERARLALKLGDVNARLGNTDEARDWWARSLRLASSPSSSDSDARNELPSYLPPSPHAQRTIAATLSSLSAYYAQSGHLADAKDVEDAGIALLAASVPPVSLASSNTTSPSPSSLPAVPNDLANHQDAATNSAGTIDLGTGTTEKSAPQTLHDLFLQHRLSLLASHRAEVNHAFQSSSPSQTLAELAKAAIGAEDIVFALTSSPSSPLANPTSSAETPAHEATLDAAYEKDRTLKGPASSLLRDARRTALHAWTISGILHENAAFSSSPSSSTTSSSSWRKFLPSSSSSSQSETERRDAEHKAALRCYTRALAWAGVVPEAEAEADKEPVPGREMLASEWKALWEGYTRTRDAVLASASPGIHVEGDDEKDVSKKA